MSETWRRGATVAGFLLCVAATAADLRGQAPWLASSTVVESSALCHPTLTEAEWSPTATCPMAGHLLEGPPNTVLPPAAAGRENHGRQRTSGVAGEGGSGSHRLLGASVGFVLGAGTTYLVLNSGGSTSRCDRSANQDAMGSGACLGAYILGGLIGAGVGAGVGALLRTDRWESLPVGGLGVAVLPEGRVGVAATLKW
ncbi:MAG: hypothetical protein AMXMBFR53_26410 [Gemmatimonadota bacterium]